MALNVGSNLGSFEITGLLGKGGMGEVYRARDSKLKREVAIKVLPDEFNRDADRLNRFQREAEVLAALNHTNIATIYDLQESNGCRFLILELVEGETLAERLARGRLPIDQVLEVAKQIADALEAAHEKQIVHRDLKPANVKIMPDGKVKVLDFGLAKGIARSPATSQSNSPTGGPATDAGIVLGTAAYMSPEQARGAPIDTRTDIWAFGCLLYETLSGRSVFSAGTFADTVAAIVKSEPDWSALPAETPSSVRRLLVRCLQKNPKQRLRDIADARIEIEDADGELRSPTTVVSTTQNRSRWLSIAPWALVLLISSLAGVALWRNSRTSPPLPQLIKVLTTLPAQTAIELGRGSAIALSPDGTKIAYSATSGARTMLYMRSLDQLDSTPIIGTEGGTNPFFSPDGQWVGFFAESKLKKISVLGGAPVVLCDAPNPRGEAWGPDDTIFFTPRNNTGVWKVSANGGAAEQLTTLAKGELSHRWPQVLPGGKGLLYTVWNDSGFENGIIVAQSLPGGERHVLLTGGGFARYISGYLVYARAEGLLATPFDLESLRVTGAAVPLPENAITNLSGGAHYAFSSNGSLVYLPGRMGEADHTLVWVDRQGKTQTVRTIQSMSLNFSLSRDGRRIVRNNTQGSSRDLWVEDLETGGSTRVTLGDYTSSAVWTPDASKITYITGLPSANIYWRRADGSGSPERLTTSPNFQIAYDWSPDGKFLAYTEIDPTTGSDIWILPIDGDRKPRLFAQTPFTETEAAFSRDGKWLAYQSNQSGRFEIYVQPFPAGGRIFQVSTEGGVLPRWSADGKELFYLIGNKMMSAAISTQPEFKSDKPTTLFEGRYDGEYALAPDGKRFLMIKGNEQESAPTQVVLVLNWLEELKRRFQR